MELTIAQALDQAIAAHKEGKLQDAERLYRAILQSQPAHPDANHNLGLLAISVNKADAALPLFRIALEANPKIEQFWLSYIDALIKRQQFESAQQVFEQAKTQGVSAEKLKVLEPRLVPMAKVNEAKSDVQPKSLSFSQKRMKLAEQKKRKAAKRNLKTNDPSQQQLSTLLEHYQHGRFNDAEKLAVFITKAFPKHQFAWKVLGAVLIAKGKISEALDVNQTAITLSPRDAAAHNNLGITLKELGRLAGAEASYKQAIALKPDYAEAHSNLGNTLKELGRLDEALESYNQAIALKPHVADDYYNLGVTLKELGRLDQASAAYNKALALDPDFAEASNNLGSTLKELGKLDEAAAAYNKALSLNPDYAQAHNNLGNTLKELGRLDEALASYNQAIALKPYHAEAHNNLGNTLKELGRLDEALASYNQAIALKPDYSEAHSNLGVALNELGRFDRALGSYSQAITLRPDYAEAHNNLGATLNELGRLDEALASYNQAIALKPDYVEAHINLGNTLKELGRWHAAEECYKQAIAFNNEDLKPHSELLMCLFHQNKKTEFCSELDYLADQNQTNAIIGSLTCRSILKYGLKKPNLFCTKPLNFVLHNNLKTRCDFENTFVKKAKSILNENRVSNRKQSLLENGNQTSGNIFDIKNDETNEIQDIIREEVEKYRVKFKNSEEGFIKRMPTDYKLYGWFVSMKSGGSLKPHIHTSGWLSGSIYINVPTKINDDSGKLVVSLGDEKDPIDAYENEKQTINVAAGSLVLFPASLMHYTNPFESEEDRIVLAFDVKGK